MFNVASIQLGRFNFDAKMCCCATGNVISIKRKIYTIDMNATPREFVPKPTCTTPQITKIHLATVSVFAGNNKPIFGFLPTIDIANSNAVRWAITMNIERYIKHIFNL
jgi:hypothetical protein